MYFANPQVLQSRAQLMQQTNAARPYHQLNQPLQPPPRPQQTQIQPPRFAQKATPLEPKLSKEEQSKLDAQRERREYNQEIKKLAALSKKEFRQWLQSQINEDDSEDFSDSEI